jgi:hypothetical protein
LSNDISLIQTNEPIVFDLVTNPIPLGSEHVGGGVIATIMG